MLALSLPQQAPRRLAQAVQKHQVTVVTPRVTRVACEKGEGGDLVCVGMRDETNLHYIRRVC